MADGPRADDDHGQALALATELHAAGDSARALELLPELVAARPDDLAVRLLLARCLTTAAGSPAVALAAAEAAVACDPTSWEAQVLLSRAALVTSPDTATVAAERAVLLAPDEPDALRARAAVQAAQTEGPEADGSTRRGSIGLAALGLRPSTTVPAGPESAEPEPRLVPRLPAALDPARAPSPPDRIDHAGSATVPPTPPHPADGPFGPRSATPTAPSLANAPAPVVPTPPAHGPLGPRPDTLAEPSLAKAPAPLPHTPPPDATPLVPDAPLVTWRAAPGPDLGAAGAIDGAPAHREVPLPVALGGTGLAGSRPGDEKDEGDQRVGGARLAIRVIGLLTWLYMGFRVGAQAIGGPVGIGLFLLVVAGVAYLARQLMDR